MRYRLAKENELQELCELYDRIILQQQYDEYGPGWTKDVYPARSDLKDHLNKDLVYVMDEEGKLVGAGVISLHEDEMYKKGKWSRKLKDEEVAVLHLFGIDPAFRGKGYTQEFLKYIIEETGKTSRAIHLDVVKGNIPAYRVYEKAGFTSAGDLGVWYEDTGDITVDLMEYNY